jgi:co-chaperonin GroES (HSP10)
MLVHDWVSIKPETQTGILKISDDSISSGIVTEVGQGYWSDSGSFIEVKGISVGQKVLFTQHLALDVNGEKVYRVRSRDIIEVL